MLLLAGIQFYVSPAKIQQQVSGLNDVVRFCRNLLVLSGVTTNEYA